MFISWHWEASTDRIHGMKIESVDIYHNYTVELSILKSDNTQLLMQNLKQSFTECGMEFIVQLEHNAEGGTAYHQINTVDGCAEKCRKTKDCIAFDYDRNIPPYTYSKCWLHTDSSIVMKSEPSVDHYFMGICQSGKHIIFSYLYMCILVLNQMIGF